MKNSKISREELSESIDQSSEIYKVHRQVFQNSLQSLFLKMEINRRDIDQVISQNRQLLYHKIIFVVLKAIEQSIEKEETKSLCKVQKSQLIKEEQLKSGRMLSQQIQDKFSYALIIYFLNLNDKKQSHKKWSTLYEILNWVLTTRFDPQIRKTIEKLSLQAIEVLTLAKIPQFIQESVFSQQLNLIIKNNYEEDREKGKTLINIQSRSRILFSLFSFTYLSINQTICLLNLLTLGMNSKDEVKEMLKSVEQQFFKKLQSLRLQGGQYGQISHQNLKQICQIFDLMPGSSQQEMQKKESRIIDDAQDIQQLYNSTNYQCIKQINSLYALQFVTKQIFLNQHCSPEKKALLEICFTKIDQCIPFFYTFLVEVYEKEEDEDICKILFKLIQKESLRYLSISRVKSLLKVIRCNMNRQELQPEECHKLNTLRLKKYKEVLLLLRGLSNKFNCSSIIYHLEDEKTSSVSIKNIRKCKTFFFYADLQQSQSGRLFRFVWDNKKIYELRYKYFSDTEEIQCEILEALCGKKISEDKFDFLEKIKKSTNKYSYAFIGVTVVPQKKGSVINFCVDDIEKTVVEKSGSQLQDITLGPFMGSIQNLYLTQSQAKLSKILEIYEGNRDKLTDLLKEELCVDKFLFCQIKTEIKQNNKFHSLIGRDMKITLEDCQKVSMISFYETIQQLGGIPNLLYLISPSNQMTQSLTASQIEEYYNLFMDFIISLAQKNEARRAHNWMKYSLTYFSEFIWILLNKCQNMRSNYHFFNKMLRYLSWHCQLQKNFPKNFIVGQVYDLTLEYNSIKTLYLNIETWSCCSKQIQQPVYRLVNKYLQHPLLCKRIMEQGFYQKILAGIIFFYLENDEKDSFSPVAELIRLLDKICSSYSHIQINYNSKFIKRDVNVFWSLISQYIIQKKNRSKKQGTFLNGFLRHFSVIFLVQKAFMMATDIWLYVLYEIGHLLQICEADYSLIAGLFILAIQIIQANNSYEKAYDIFILDAFEKRKDPQQAAFSILVEIIKNWPESDQLNQKLDKLFSLFHDRLKKNSEYLTYEDLQANIFSLHKSQFAKFFMQKQSVFIVGKSMREKEYFKMGVIILDRIIKYNLYEELGDVAGFCFKWMLTAIPKTLLNESEIFQKIQPLEITQISNLSEVENAQKKIQYEYNKAHINLLTNFLNDPHIFYKLVIYTQAKSLLQLCQLLKLWSPPNPNTMHLPIRAISEKVVSGEKKGLDLGLLFLSDKTHKQMGSMLQFLSIMWLNEYAERSHVNNLQNCSLFIIPTYITAQTIKYLQQSAGRAFGQQFLYEALKLTKIMKSFLENKNFGFQYSLLLLLSKYSKQIEALYKNTGKQDQEAISALTKRIYNQYIQTDKFRPQTKEKIQKSLKILIDIEGCSTPQQLKSYLKKHQSKLKSIRQQYTSLLQPYNNLTKICFSFKSSFSETSPLPQKTQKPVNKAQNSNKKKKINQISDIQFYHPYSTFLQQKINQIYKKYKDEANKKEEHWKKLANQNIFWDSNKIRDNQCYQIDEKMTGFYRLNISKTKFEEVPYPRRKSFEFQSVSQEKYPFDQIIAQNTNTNFASICSKEDEQAIIGQSMILESSQPKRKLKALSYSSVYAAYITPRGIYAGRFYIEEQSKYFVFEGISFDDFPDELVYKHSIVYHRINDPSFSIKIPYSDDTQILARRFIHRHTAFEIFTEHKSYFFNFFKVQVLEQVFKAASSKVNCIIDLRQQFQKKKFTERWQIGAFDNFQYLMLVNKYSGRTFNELGQYPVFPWVLVNYKDKIQINDQYLSDTQNLRDLTKPAGKLNEEKFAKLKMRCMQIQQQDYQIRFLYGTMYSNPTVIYNFFIRLEPFTSLHWDHQGKKIDHADRLFYSIKDQFSTVLTSSSDNKQLTPEFYYWPEFLKNRNKVDLGVKQNSEQVHAVRLPPWAQNAQQFIFKMREALESPYVTENLNHWIDLVFGYKSPYEVAQQYDNLFHYRTYPHDIFETEQTQEKIRGAQITVTQFGQIPFNLFTAEHPKKISRGPIEIDNYFMLRKSDEKRRVFSFKLSKSGVILSIEGGVQIINTDIGVLTEYSPVKSYQSEGHSAQFVDTSNSSWYSLKDGIFRTENRKKSIINQFDISAQIYCTFKKYIVFGIHSKIVVAVIKEDNKMYRVHSFYGHKSRIVILKSCPILDIIVSVDEDGLVMVHQFDNLLLMREFEVNKTIQANFDNKIKLIDMQIHKMGYFIFLTDTQKIFIFTFLGQLYLEQDICILANKCSQKITTFDILNPNRSILLLGTDKGNIYETDFIQMKKYSNSSPFKIYSRIKKNIIQQRITKKTGIKQLSIVRIPGYRNLTYRLFVLYQDNEFGCFFESRQLSEQVKSNKQFISLGLLD